MNRAAMLAYLPWHLRDAALKAAAPAVIFAIVVIPVLLAMGGDGMADFRSGDARSMARGVFLGTASFTIWFGGLIVMSETIAIDRDRQYYRFLFANAVVPWQLYLQRFAVGLVAFVAIYALVPTLYSWRVTEVPIATTILAAALSAFFIGGMVAVTAALTRRDAIVAAVAYGVTNGLQSASNQDALVDWLDPVVRALPPVASFVDVREGLLQGIMPAAGVLWHIGLYGAGMLALGLYLVKRLPLAR
jgi:hypothetical protein